MYSHEAFKLLAVNFPEVLRPYREQIEGRSMIVKKAKPLAIECIVRGYLSGSGWKEYKKSQTVCGIPLPAGLTESAELPQSIFTPSTKAEAGHDENISFERVVGCVNRFHAVDAPLARGAGNARVDSTNDSRRCSVDDVSDARMKLQIGF